MTNQQFKTGDRIQHHDGTIGYFVGDWTKIEGEQFILATSHILDLKNPADPSKLLYKWKLSQCRLK